MLDEYRIEQMGVGAYVDSIDEEVIAVDQAVQRAFCWSNEMINNLIYSTVSPKRIYIPNIILAEEKREDPFKGQKIGVFKANLIIPQLRWAEEFVSDGFEEDMKKSFIHVPNRCPVCGESTKIIKENDSEVLWCINPECKGKLLGKLTHAVSRNALNIDGLSEATIQKFISLGWLNSIQDIYYLNTHEKQMKTLDGFGSKSVSKLFQSIEKSRNTTLDRFLYALSIPLWN